ncbi:hypothetical protein JTE90_003422 [Oedothorax gibbosus]|uniref:Uncharacterized protein n=1 Tax=Oedothorax gibbosus TaxID=931172 RepID=A0AAV6TYN4_9ARAC|nr:hypothetical protein JTE90_003422 [Oedothorax gibbosus]
MFAPSTSKANQHIPGSGSSSPDSRKMSGSRSFSSDSRKMSSGGDNVSQPTNLLYRDELSTELFESPDENSILTNQEIDNIVREWQIYRVDEDIDEFCDGFIKIVDTEKNVVKYERLDSFYWAKVLKLNDKIFGAKKYDILRLIKACLSLSHGNADPERGVSVDKTIVSP